MVYPVIHFKYLKFPVKSVLAFYTACEGPKGLFISSILPIYNYFYYDNSPNELITKYTIFCHIFTSWTPLAARKCGGTGRRSARSSPRPRRQSSGTVPASSRRAVSSTARNRTGAPCRTPGAHNSRLN
eukprot:343315-Prorocentrum_minimum.AAC.3